MAAAKCGQVTGVIIRSSILPTPPEDAVHLKASARKMRVMVFSCSLLLSVERVSPRAKDDGFTGPLHKALAEESRSVLAPVRPELLHAFLLHGRDAGISLETGGRSKTFTAVAEGDQQAGCKGGAGARELTEKVGDRMRGKNSAVRRSKSAVCC